MQHSPCTQRLRKLAVMIVLASCGTAYAEEELPVIAVTASSITDTALPKVESIYTDALISLRATTSDTAGLLRNLPGVYTQTAGGVSGLPVIRGLADDRIRTKVNGMDLIAACGNHMNSPLSYIDATAVGSAKVYAGITPVSVGGDSIGSTIKVDSPDPEFASSSEEMLTKGEVGFSYRSNGNGLAGNVAATMANEKFSISYQGSAAKADNYKAGGDFKPAGPAAAGREWLDGDEVGSTMYKTINHLVTMGYQHENHLFDLKIGKQDIPYQGYPNQRMDMTGNDSTYVNLRYEGEYNWGTLEARAYNEQTRHKMQFYENKLYWYAPNGSGQDGIPCTPSGGGQAGCAAGMPMDTEGKNTGLLVMGDIELSERDQLKIGAEAQNYRLDDWWEPSGRGMWPGTMWNINNGQRDRRALFGDWEAQWNSQWMTQLGLRYERVNMDTGEVRWYNTGNMWQNDADAFNAADRKRTDNNIDVTAMARYTPDANRTIEFGYGRKTRSPNLYERYAWSTNGMAMRMVNWAGDGNGYVGNLDLEPEISHTISATFDWHDANQSEWGLSVTPYYTYVDDYIDAERCKTTSQSPTHPCNGDNATREDDFVYLQFVNQSARLYGIDISGYFPLAENTKYGNFTAYGTLNYTRGENDTTGDNLYNIMPLNAKLSVEQRKGNWSNVVEVELVADKDDVSAVRNEMETESYGLLHLRSSYQWKNARFDFGIENVFDTFYNHPLGGAYLGQGKTMPHMIPWGTPVPGMGRSLYAGVNYAF